MYRVELSYKLCFNTPYMTQISIAMITRVHISKSSIEMTDWRFEPTNLKQEGMVFSILPMSKCFRHLMMEKPLQIMIIQCYLISELSILVEQRITFINRIMSFNLTHFLPK